jgi:hypothetical protein
VIVLGKDAETLSVQEQYEVGVQERLEAARKRRQAEKDKQDALEVRSLMRLRNLSILNDSYTENPKSSCRRRQKSWRSNVPSPESRLESGQRLPRCTIPTLIKRRRRRVEEERKVLRQKTSRVLMRVKVARRRNNTKGSSRDVVACR